MDATTTVTSVWILSPTSRPGSSLFHASRQTPNITTRANRERANHPAVAQKPQARWTDGANEYRISMSVGGYAVVIVDTLLLLQDDQFGACRNCRPRRCDRDHDFFDCSS